jgi:uncharacterized protein (DUF2062 family)
VRIPAPRSTKPFFRRLGHLLLRWWRRILVIQDTPHRVAWGFAIGMFITWLPIVGAQMLVAAGVCWLLRANILASMPPVWISNPLTLLPMYYAINHVGAWFAGTRITSEQIEDILATVGELGLIDGTGYLFTELWSVLLAMMIGGLIIGLACAIPSYFIIYRAVVGFQHQRMQRRLRWLTKRIERRPTKRVDPISPEDNAP